MKKLGFTLIELVTVMAILAVVMGVSVAILMQALDWQRNYDEYSEQMRSVDRLIGTFREDVRTLGKPENLSDGDTLLRWKTDTKTIDYTILPGEFPNQLNVVRSVLREGQMDEYEIYRLPDRSALRFVAGQDNDAGLIALSLWTSPLGTELPNLDDLNPFDRTIPKSLEQKIDPKYAGNWRTIVTRY